MVGRYQGACANYAHIPVQSLAPNANYKISAEHTFAVVLTTEGTTHALSLYQNNRRTTVCADFGSPYQRSIEIDIGSVPLAEARSLCNAELGLAGTKWGRWDSSAWTGKFFLPLEGKNHANLVQVPSRLEVPDSNFHPSAYTKEKPCPSTRDRIKFQVLRL